MDRFLVLTSDEHGDFQEDKRHTLVGRSGHIMRPPEPIEMMQAPDGTEFHFLPGRRPQGWSRKTNAMEVLDRGLPVAAVLPNGYARTLMPAYRKTKGAPILPLFGYTACGLRGDDIWVAAMPTEQTFRWSNSQYNTEDLPLRVKRRLKQFPENRLLRHLSRCALEYRCFTSQNMFYQRWEGAIPVSPACNAVCRGCLSLIEDAGHPPSPQERLSFVPTLQEVVELTIDHLNQGGGSIMSFGQGCEGEPTLQADLIAEAIRQVRAQTDKGTININTNASFPGKLEKIIEAGLDEVRVSLNSVHAPWYEAYYRPRNYRFTDVEESVRRARAKDIFISLNLLFMPGVNDTPAELERLIGFVERHHVNKIQMRNLNIDPDEYIPILPGLAGRPVGIPVMLDKLRKACPWLAIGNFSPALRD